MRYFFVSYILFIFVNMENKKETLRDKKLAKLLKALEPKSVIYDFEFRSGLFAVIAWVLISIGIIAGVGYLTPTTQTQNSNQIVVLINK